MRCVPRATHSDVSSVIRRLNRVLAVLAGCLAIAGSTACGQDSAVVLQAFEDATVKLIEQAEPAVVAVSRIPRKRATFSRPGKDVFGPLLRDRPAVQSNNPFLSDYLPTDFGAGVLVTPRDKPQTRLVLTNYHLVKGGGTVADPEGKSEHLVFVQMTKSQSCEALIYAADPRSDLAVLKLDSRRQDSPPEENLPSIPLYDGDTLKKGRFVFAFGNPYAIARDGQASVSFGMVSNVARSPFVELRSEKQSGTIHSFGTLLQVDTRLNLGTSGGALLNRQGQLVGITTSLAALQGFEGNVGFAIPISRATRRIVDALLAGQEAEYGFLGIEPSTHELGMSMAYGVPAGQRSVVRVDRVKRQSPAEVAGLKSGDFILAINNRPAQTSDDLMREIGLAGPGARVSLQLVGQRVLTVVTGKWPSRDGDGIVFTNDRYPIWRGIKVDWPTARLEHTDVEFSIPYPSGVLITSVAAGSPAERADCKVGHIINEVAGKPIRTPSEFHEAVKNLKGGALLRLNGSKLVTVE